MSNELVMNEDNKELSNKVKKKIELDLKRITTSNKSNESNDSIESYDSNEINIKVLDGNSIENVQTCSRQACSTQNVDVEFGQNAGAELGQNAGAELGQNAGTELGQNAGAELGQNAGTELGQNDLDLLDDITVYTDDDRIEFGKINEAIMKIERSKFNKHIQEKISKLDIKMRYAGYKFEDIRHSYTNYSISIIIISTVLTLTEAFMNTVDLEDLPFTILTNILKFIPLILSTLISLLAALIKFNKYEEQIEDITRANENCIGTISKLKEVREELHFCEDMAEFENICTMYLKKVYKTYLDSNINIEKQLKDTDYARYMKRVAKNDIKMTKLSVLKNKILREIKSSNNTDSVEVNICKLDKIADENTQSCNCLDCWNCFACMCCKSNKSINCDDLDKNLDKK